MKKKHHVYSGAIEVTPSKQIYLNINHLTEGIYTLKITHKNKVIKQTTFKKPIVIKKRKDESN
jgi:hypothetical protein